MKQCSAEQRLVLDEVEASGNEGIWTRDIKKKTSLTQQVVSKALKFLESRKYIKSVRSINSKNKKLYMLYDTSMRW